VVVRAALLADAGMTESDDEDRFEVDDLAEPDDVLSTAAEVETTQKAALHDGQKQVADSLDLYRKTAEDSASGYCYQVVWGVVLMLKVLSKIAKEPGAEFRIHGMSFKEGAAFLCEGRDDWDFSNVERSSREESQHFGVAQVKFKQDDTISLIAMSNNFIDSLIPMLGLACELSHLLRHKPVLLHFLYCTSNSKLATPVPPALQEWYDMAVTTPDTAILGQELSEETVQQLQTLWRKILLHRNAKAASPWKKTCGKGDCKPLPVNFSSKGSYLEHLKQVHKEFACKHCCKKSSQKRLDEHEKQCAEQEALAQQERAAKPSMVDKALRVVDDEELFHLFLRSVRIVLLDPYAKLIEEGVAQLLDYAAVKSNRATDNLATQCRGILMKLCFDLWAKVVATSCADLAACGTKMTRTQKLESRLCLLADLRSDIDTLLLKAEATVALKIHLDHYDTWKSNAKRLDDAKPPYQTYVNFLQHSGTSKDDIMRSSELPVVNQAVLLTGWSSAELALSGILPSESRELRKEQRQRNKASVQEEFDRRKAAVSESARGSMLNETASAKFEAALAEVVRNPVVPRDTVRTESEQGT
jgi:hypothetical protein